MPVKRLRSVGAVNLVLAILLSIVGAQFPPLKRPFPPLTSTHNRPFGRPGSGNLQGVPRKIRQSYLTTKHGQQGNPEGPDCQTCHANALEHAKAGGGKGVAGIFGFNNKKIPAEQKAAVCM